MQETIDKIKRLLQSNPLYWLKVKDMQSSRFINNRVDQTFLNEQYNGSFTEYLDNLKRTKVEKISITQRKKHGSSSQSAGPDVVINLSPQKTSTPEQQIPGVIPVAPKISDKPSYSDAMAQMLANQLATAQNECNLLKTQNLGLNGEKTALSLKEIALNAEIKALKKDLKLAHKSKKKAKKKSKKPQGLAGIIPAEDTSTFIENLPNLISTTVAAFKGETTEQPINVDGPNPAAQAPEMHQNVCNALLLWPKELLEELTAIMLKYQVKSDENEAFVSQLRSMLNNKSIQTLV